jgi:hypothetical protein
MGVIDKIMARDPEMDEREPEKISEMALAIDRITADLSQDQKSNLISVNIKGITRAEALQNYTATYYGFRIGGLDALIDKKISVVKSRDGWGIDKTLRGLATLQNKIETNIGAPNTPLDNLMGKR